MKKKKLRKLSEQLMKIGYKSLDKIGAHANDDVTEWMEDFWRATHPERYDKDGQYIYTKKELKKQNKVPE